MTAEILENHTQGLSQTTPQGEAQAQSLFYSQNAQESAFKAHFECVFASEIDEKAQQTYALNHPHTALYGDITLESTQKAISRFDLLCASSFILGFLSVFIAELLLDIKSDCFVAR